MPIIVVDVMPKPEILDPQGKAINGALPRLGFTEFSHCLLYTSPSPRDRG